MLVIPIIKICNGLATTNIQCSFCGKIGTNIPAELAVILRGENFKALHIGIEDKNENGKRKTFKSIKEILEKVDIPLIISAYLFNDIEISELFQLGCYRITLNFPSQDNKDRIKNLIRIFSPARIVLRLNILNRQLYDCVWEKLPFSLENAYSFLKEIGVQRILLSCFQNKEEKIIDYEFLNEVLSVSKIRHTFIGGVKNLDTLLRISKFEKLGLDSVVIGKAIYENKFNCQLLWRENEKYLNDLGPTRRI